jgi:hypothetical protein
MVNPHFAAVHGLLCSKHVFQRLVESGHFAAKSMRAIAVRLHINSLLKHQIKSGSTQTKGRGVLKLSVTRATCYTASERVEPWFMFEDPTT